MPLLTYFIFFSLQILLFLLTLNQLVSSSSHLIIVVSANVNDAYRIFLKHHTCYDLIPLSAKLIVFDVSLNVSTH